MKVKTLIRLLRKYDPEKIVWVNVPYDVQTSTDLDVRIATERIYEGSSIKKGDLVILG